MDRERGIVGILAYGSLIAEPGDEIQAVMIGKIDGVETPFNVEFARKSNRRNYAPTLVPVEEGGERVRASVLLLNTSIEDASDRLYRREINKVGTSQRYQHPAEPGQDTVLIKRLTNFQGICTVLHTHIGANIDDRTAANLARLAIGSARELDDGRDGISYLINAKRCGITTKLSAAYEDEIKKQLSANDLDDALRIARGESAAAAMLGDRAYKWPKAGDRLLRIEGDPLSAASFEEHVMARQVFLWDGYMRAGAALIERCQPAENRVFRHDLIYPMLFCYRHGLELAIKWIIEMYGRYAAIPDRDVAHHDLWRLWAVCKQVIIEVGSDGETEALLAVEQLVKDFHELDQGSFSFRYSTNKSGMVISLPNVAFDLENIMNVMEAVNNFFTGADGQLNNNSRGAA